METTAGATTYVGAAPPEIDARRAATRLRNLLRLNSGFSMLTGAVGLIGPDQVAEVLGIDQAWLVRLVSAGLLGFAAMVLAVAGIGTSALGRWSQVVSFNDLGWVAGTLVVIGSGWLSTRGVIVMGLIGLAVLGLGVSQIRARRGLLAALTDPDPDPDPDPDSTSSHRSRSSTSRAVRLSPPASAGEPPPPGPASPHGRTGRRRG